MIKISNIHMEENIDSCLLCAEVATVSETKQLYYKVAPENGIYLCDELADSFLIAILLFAMESGEDISIAGTPISERLYYNLTNFLIPALATRTNYKKVNIISQLSSNILEHAGFNGTGISCGIDSFYTMAEDCPEQFKINCLTMFNMGSHGDWGGRKLGNYFYNVAHIQKNLPMNMVINSFGWIPIFLILSR